MGVVVQYDKPLLGCQQAIGVCSGLGYPMFAIQFPLTFLGKAAVDDN